MFWRFGFNNPSAIDGLLEQEDVTLEEILCDQDIIQEAKSQNPKLIEFLLKKENIAQLIALFFSLDIDKQRLPLIACEILACEIPQLIDAIVIEHVEILEDFWNFLKLPFSPDASYSFQSSYFCKIITIFLTKRALEMLDFIKSKPANLDMILSHLQSSAIMDLLLTLVRLEELPEAKGTVQWLNDNGLLLNLINRLDPNLETEEHCTAQQCICEIIRMSQTSLLESPSIGVNDIILQLTSKEVMEKLVNYMLDSSKPNSTSTLINGVTIIIDIIRHNNSDMDNETAAVVMGYGNQTVRQPMISLVDMLRVLTLHIQDFNHLLLNPKTVPQLMVRESLPIPLGFERLKICELFAELLHCSNMSSLNITKEDEPTPGDLLKLEFVKHKVLPTCTDLFFYFPWNNFLHYVVYDMLHQVFNGQMNKESNRQLALSIFTQGHLTDKIVQAQEKNDIECQKPKGMRLGYMGHLTFISDEVIKLFEGYPEGIISAVKDSIDLDKWHVYCVGQLKETKERDSLPLGEIRQNGMHAIINDDDDDDEEEEEDEEEDEDHTEATLRSQMSRFDTSDQSHDTWITRGNEDYLFTETDYAVNENPAGLVVSHQADEEKEDEETTVDWTGGFSDSFTAQPAAGLQTPQKHDSPEDDDPFGDFNSSNSTTEPDQTWQDGFSTNFADMDVKEKNLKKETPASA
ncbi:SIT4 phosphatase-associated protein-domain-containing protein [Mucor mucedo]|uniref:SIT4 phosphatase-associated protein-domain-containing protein n=1 Tax=Mucor mucedo TaxID=29922 RepID=UPI0022200DAD|nr:SIT4 phosphatase-associated protein-domain-containing protein [Mucor mucedo]KAI7867052.1 SIT4 phosphatase-associated protein-domain-containing protein [Mucor mucedo]